MVDKLLLIQALRDLFPLGALAERTEHGQRLLAQVDRLAQKAQRTVDDVLPRRDDDLVTIAGRVDGGLNLRELLGHGQRLGADRSRET